jgi:hypothetical protein
VAKACWFAATLDGIGPCEGRMDRAHLIPAQLLRRELGGAESVACPECHVGPGQPCFKYSTKRLPHLARESAWGEVLWSPVVPGCRRHHGMLDHSRQIRIPRGLLPASVEEFAAEHGLTWWIERTYGGGPWEVAA